MKTQKQDEQQVKNAREAQERQIEIGLGRTEGKGCDAVLFVKVNAVVVLTTGVTATGGVLASSADAALTHRCLTTLVAGVLKS
jgi:hypothetical protein